MPIFFALFALALAAPVLWPRLDLILSGLFYRPEQGFFLANDPVFLALHWLAYYGARGLGVGCTALALFSFLRRQPVCGIDAKAWSFLLLALLIGPALLANAGFKDHWGRARPREIVEFGGSAAFSPALLPQPDIRHNGSFVSGDGAFGFFLPVFAYVVSRHKARRVFWGAMGVAGLFGLARLAMGAHFFSDIAYAGFFMLLTSAATHAAFYGRKATADCWRSWFTRPASD